MPSPPSSGWTVTNFGTIASAGDNAVNFKGVAAGTLSNITNATPAHAAIYSSVGGTIINGSGDAPSATISGPRTAISFNDNAGTVISFGTVVNYGSLISTGTTAGSGLCLGQGGVLKNEASGLITADLDGVSIKTAAGLGYAADNGGLATYQDTLGGGWSLAGVRSDIAHSAEAQSDLTPPIDGTLNRDPNAAELAGAESTLAQGGSLAGIAGTLSGGGTAGGFATVTASAGDATLSAAAGPTQFLFSDVAFGQDTIQGFDPTQDAVVLGHAQAPDAATLLADAAATGAGTLVTLSPAQSILLQGVAPSSLHPNNFRVV